MVDQILTVIFTGLISGGVTIITLKNDFKWIKSIIEEHKQLFVRHDERLRHIERKVK